ncbi:2-hydroxyacid dehydrogenase [Burkholderia glumae]|uniref:2-hydroxyacid dehydrogenase n=1 Tax=Burkholderia glumae TaxID=337 RepID=UPI001297C9FD|nr:glyoxylate/hydroxypyruvate reductase A [Burkholderia glumae]MCM2549077.1 glyoxylate/hydroxypyruvate reductase A [Burkholderia glumae]NVE23331.1 glyoxylate/hydroxypyruvate reductase A [Burkholderia glumae]QGA39053.1 glyoxylate/hydroxypyruvate reductase A [Burkholderia glumae]UVS97213.1 glyoxylate/hydroxypyruvate reductase A [Burkholderia glumae]
MQILLHYSDGELSDWQRETAAALPGAVLRAWQPGDDARADYALVWQPPAALLAPRDGLKAIFILGAGVDALLALERERPGTLPAGVPLVRLEDSGMGAQMVEYVVYGVLRHLRRFDDYAAQQRDRRWAPLPVAPRERFVVGVLGLGVLGARVARALAGLGLTVRGFSRSAKALDGVACSAGTPRAGDPAFDAFSSDLRVLVNLLPGTPDTEGVLNARLFARLAPGALLVNVARGAHLVEADLLDALATGRLGAALLDVLREEPPRADHPFWQHPRITLTPHVSAETERGGAIAQIAAKIRAFERGEPVGGIVDLARGY